MFHLFFCPVSVRCSEMEKFAGTNTVIRTGKVFTVFSVRRWSKKK